MNADGFEQAVHEHKDRVHGYACWMLGDRDQARDVSQEALVRLWEHRERVPAEGLRSWLIRTTHNLCIDRLRQRAVRSGPALDAVEPTLADGGPGPGRSAESEQIGRRIAAALATLPPRERAIVLMREVHELPYAEIAQALCLPLGTLKATLHRAREKLRRQLLQVGLRP